MGSTSSDTARGTIGWGVDLGRNPERAIPAVEAPTLAELGLAAEVRPTNRTRLVFAARPFVAAGAVIGLGLAGWWLPALALFPALYGWSLTSIHHMIHGSLRYRARTRSILLTAISLILLESGHALERTHLQHHGTDPTSDDPEGYIESLGWWRLLAEAPLFRYRLWHWAIRNPGPEENGRRRAVEIGWHLAVTVTALGLVGAHVAGVDLGRLGWGVVAYVGTQHLANATFAVLAARGPHTNWGRPTPTPLIAVRGRLSRWLLFGHVWHLEHHLYPEVPLPLLASVADRIEPLLQEHEALVVSAP